MGLIPEEIIAQVLDRCDIVTTISNYIPLKRAGRNFKANCPFHNEKTPSFVVNPDKQIFHCFGCGVGGNVVTFVKLQERVEFPEAVRMLAGNAGIVVPTTEGDTQALRLKDMLYNINDLAVQFFHNALVGNYEGNHIARQYLKDRGVTLAIVKKFRMGFAPEKRDGILSYLRSKDIGLSLIEKSGLIIAAENREGYFDRFRNRIVFPICDVRSRCIGFGARALKEDIAKYVNSPETPLYTKGNHLYGLHLAKEAVRTKDVVVIVEGYMDFIIPFQAGVDNIVASLGTALTVEQIRLLRRYTPNVIMLFDADKAGEAAMIRSLDLLIEEGMSVRVASLSAGEDPDSFIRHFGVDEFNRRITEALSLFEYKLKILMGQYSHKTVEGKAKISSEMLPTINKFSNTVMKFGYIKELSQILGVSEQALLIELQKIGKPREQQAKDSSAAALKTALTPMTRVVEYNLLKIMLEEESFVPLAKNDLLLSDFRDERMRSIIEKIFALLEQGKSVNVLNLMSCFSDEQILQFITQLSASETDSAPPANRQRLYEDHVNRMRDERLRFARQDLSSRIRLAEEAGDEVVLEQLKQQFNQLLKS